MVPVAEKERVKSLIKETLTLLCKNGLAFDRKFTIEALIGITIDEDDILLLSMNELIKSDQFDKKRSKRAPSLSSCDGSDEEEEEGLASMHRDVKLEYSPPAKRVKNKSAHSQNNQSNNHSADNGSQELSVIDKSEVLIECEDLREDSEDDDIIIKQEVDDQVAWMSPDPETSHPALMSPDPETSHPALMLPGTADTYQNTNIFTSPTGFYPGQSRTSTATSTDANTSEQQGIDVGDYSRDNLCRQSTDGNDYTQEEPCVQDIDGQQMREHPTRRPWRRNHGEVWSNWMTQHLDNISEHSGFMCKICNKSYKTKDYLQRHEKSHDSSLIMCKKCTQYFPSHEQYEIHVELKHGQMERKHICAICGKGFNRAQYLQRHILQHEKRMAKTISTSLPIMPVTEVGEVMFDTDVGTHFQQ